MRVPEDVKALFVPPFTCDPDVHSSVHDSRGEMVVTDWHRHSATRKESPSPRGWGRIQYLRDGERLMDKWVGWYAENIGDETDLRAITKRLNTAWGSEPARRTQCARAVIGTAMAFGGLRAPFLRRPSWRGSAEYCSSCKTIRAAAMDDDRLCSWHKEAARRAIADGSLSPADGE